jgi:sporulation protein YlmC with PRC-barrel domain
MTSTSQTPISTPPLAWATALAAATLLTASFGESARAQGPAPVALVVVDVHAVALGYRASELRGRTVSNDHGEKIGAINDLIIGQDKVLFAVLSVGGFLGLGDHKVAVPYGSLQISPQKIVLPGATKAALTALPEFKYLH